MCQGEGKCLSQGGGNLGVGSSVDLLFFALIKGKVITVGPIHDKFNKACKTATAIANYCGSITTINTTEKPSLLQRQ